MTAAIAGYTGAAENNEHDQPLVPDYDSLLWTRYIGRPISPVPTLHFAVAA